MKYAWIENNKIRDLAINPTEQFHPDIAAFYSQSVPDNVQLGWDWDGTTATAPIVVAPVPIPDPVVRIVAPVSTPKATAFTIDVSVVDANDNSAIALTDTYYIPLKDAMTGLLDQIIVLPIVNGIGSVQVTVAAPGIYDFDEDMIRPKPTSRIETIVDVVVV